VVEAGLTEGVPPLGCRLYVLPSVPVTVTVVAFVAVTVSVDEAPEAMEVGVAEIVTVGNTGATTVTVVLTEAVVPPAVAVAV
jgi:hypothetical protein